MQDFIISTTPTLEGYRVVKYLGPVVVPSVGAGDIIKDWLAGFTDMFGGKSHSYQKVFAKFINEGVSEMTKQARQYGANAIVNFRIETANITKGKSVISVLLYGTAVVVKQIKTQEESSDGEGLDRQAG